jgi:hypothetical protein
VAQNLRFKKFGSDLRRVEAQKRLIRLKVKHPLDVDQKLLLLSLRHI